MGRVLDLSPEHVPEKTIYMVWNSFDKIDDE